MTILDDPLVAGRKMMQFVCYDTDTGATSNPRVQVAAPYFLTPGVEWYIGLAIKVPTDWPDTLPNDGTPGWLVLHEVYGPPFNGTGPFAVVMRPAGNLALSSNLGNPETDPWTAPLPKDRWIDLVFRFTMGTPGWVEMWMNTGTGWQQQTFAGGGTRLARNTLDASNNGGPNSSQVKVYRKLGMFSVLTAYFADHRIGSSFAAVAPRSY